MFESLWVAIQAVQFACGFRLSAKLIRPVARIFSPCVNLSVNVYIDFDFIYKTGGRIASKRKNKTKNENKKNTRGW
jgi:hypothetical protein